MTHKPAVSYLISHDTQDEQEQAVVSGQETDQDNPQVAGEYWQRRNRVSLWKICNGWFLTHILIHSELHFQSESPSKREDEEAILKTQEDPKPGQKYEVSNIDVEGLSNTNSIMISLDSK